MPYVGYDGVANQANTTDGFALGVGAKNNPSIVNEFGLYVGGGGVVNLYSNITPVVYGFLLKESSGYLLQEDSGKIELEV
jgi:hypothetical protein